MCLPSLFQEHGAVVDRRDPSRERALPVDWLGRDDLGQPSREPPVIRLVPEWAVQPGRGDLQRVRVGEARLAELVLDVEQRAQVLADALTLVDADTFLR